MNPQTRRNSDLRRSNSLFVVDLLRLHGRLSRAELAEHTTLSSQGLALILNELVAREVVIEIAPKNVYRGRGRPALYYEFNPTRFSVAAIYVGLRYCEVSLCDGLGRRLTDNVEFSPGWHPERIADEAARRLEQMRADAGATDHPCTVTVVLHGWVDERRGEATSRGMSWERVPIVSRLEEQTGLDVHIVEASRAAAIAEHREGAAAGCHRATVLNIGPEMMAALVVDGEVDTGASGQAGMIGRCQVVTSDGIGPIDELVGSVASTERYNAASGESVEWMSDVYRRARDGDPHAIAVVDLQVEAIGHASGWIVAIDDPERLVFTGAINDYSEAHKAKLHTAIVERVDPRMLQHCSIRFTALGRQAWVRGGIHDALARQRSTDSILVP